jgi:hypothetical protein
MTVFTFDHAQEILAAQEKRGFDKKKLANNTYLTKKDDAFVIRLHDTDIVKIKEESSQTFFTVNTDGWMTSTTKERINSFTPLRIFQKRGVWYVYQQIDGREEVVQFFDGMTVDQSGRVVNSAEASLDGIERGRKLDQMITDYIKKFCDQSIKEGLPLPNAGDCWLCKIYSQAKNEQRDQDHMDHVYSHLEETYIHGSFLVYAATVAGYSNPGFILAIIQQDCQRGDVTMLKRVFRSFFKKVRRKLLKFAEQEVELRAE